MKHKIEIKGRLGSQEEGDSGEEEEEEEGEDDYLCAKMHLVRQSTTNMINR